MRPPSLPAPCCPSLCKPIFPAGQPVGLQGSAQHISTPAGPWYRFRSLPKTVCSGLDPCQTTAVLNVRRSHICRSAKRLNCTSHPYPAAFLRPPLRLSSLSQDLKNFSLHDTIVLRDISTSHRPSSSSDLSPSHGDDVVVTAAKGSNSHSSPVPVRKSATRSSITRCTPVTSLVEG